MPFGAKSHALACVLVSPACAIRVLPVVGTLFAASAIMKNNGQSAPRSFLPGLAVIDAGHGGQHPLGKSTPLGVRGPSGTLEKDVTLELAHMVAAHLRGRAILTRND